MGWRSLWNTAQRWTSAHVVHPIYSRLRPSIYSVHVVSSLSSESGGVWQDTGAPYHPLVADPSYVAHHDGDTGASGLDDRGICKRDCTKQESKSRPESEPEPESIAGSAFESQSESGSLLESKRESGAQPGRRQRRRRDARTRPSRNSASAQDDQEWRRRYALSYGTDALSDVPLDHAVLLRLGATWRLLWSLRQPLCVDDTQSNRALGAKFDGECMLDDGTIVRGQYRLCLRRTKSHASDARSPLDARSPSEKEQKEAKVGTTACWKVRTRIEIPLVSEQMGLVLVLHGFGAVVYPDGALLEGAFVMGLPHGMARSSSTDRGDAFGRWQHGRLDGRAIATTVDGWIVCATWENGHVDRDYFAQGLYGEQFRCRSARDCRFDGLARRGFNGGDYALERWSDGRLVDIVRYRIAPVLDEWGDADRYQCDALARGATIEGCAWTCVWLAAGHNEGGYISYPADVAGSAFALYYAYVASPESARALVPARRDALLRAMCSARSRAALYQWRLRCRRQETRLYVEQRRHQQRVPQKPQLVYVAPTGGGCDEAADAPDDSKTPLFGDTFRCADGIGSLDADSGDAEDRERIDVIVAIYAPDAQSIPLPTDTDDDDNDDASFLVIDTIGCVNGADGVDRVRSPLA